MYTEKDNRKVKVLGTKYKILFVDENNKRLNACNADGITDNTTKELIIGYWQQRENSVHDLDEYQKKVIRHEIVHAFLYESGLAESSVSVDSWAKNEEMVDWIARQHKKLHKAFKKAGAL